MTDARDVAARPVLVAGAINTQQVARVQRAPDFFQKFHLEWLYRLIQEPWRFQRMSSTLPRFVGEVMKRG